MVDISSEAFEGLEEEVIWDACFIDLERRERSFGDWDSVRWVVIA